MRSSIDEAREVVGDEVGIGEVGGGHDGLLFAVDDYQGAGEAFRCCGEFEDKLLQAVLLCHERFEKCADVVDGEEAVVVSGVLGFENLRLSIAIVGNGLRRQTDCVR